MRDFEKVLERKLVVVFTVLRSYFNTRKRIGNTATCTQSKKVKSRKGFGKAVSAFFLPNIYTVNVSYCFMPVLHGVQVCLATVNWCSSLRKLEYFLDRCSGSMF